MRDRSARILSHWRWFLTIGLCIGIGGFAAHGNAVSDPLPTAESVQTGSITSERKPAAITVTRVERRKIRQTLMVTGSLVAREEVLVGAQIDDVRLEQYLVDVGDRVEAGQVLALLDRSLLENRLAQNALEIAKAEATVRQTAAAIIELEATLAEGERAATRARTLKQTGVVSDETLQSRETSLQVTRARLEGQRESLVFAKAAKDYAMAQREEIALGLSRTLVRAPASGVVSTRNANVGQLVGTSSDPLFRIIGDGAIELEADVVDSRLDSLAAGQQVVLTLDGHEPTNGKIRLVAPGIDPVTRLGKVRIALEPGQGLRPGRFVTAVVEIRTRDSLVVPPSAILFGTEGPRVQVISDGRVKSRGVVVGMSDATGTEIVEGLVAGESVVAKAGGFLRDGERISPVYSPQADVMTSPVSRMGIN